MSHRPDHYSKLIDGSIIEPSININNTSHIQRFAGKTIYTCPFELDPDGRPVLDEECWQCRLRNLIDNKIFFLVYIFSLFFLSQFSSFFTIVIYIFVMVIVVFLASFCSLHTSLFMMATQGLLLSSIVTLLASYLIRGIMRLL